MGTELLKYSSNTDFPFYLCTATSQAIAACHPELVEGDKRRKVRTAQSNAPVKSRPVERQRDSATENNYQTAMSGKDENVG